MNARRLAKKVGTQLRLRPLPRRRAEDGRDLGSIDDQWFVVEILKEPTRVTLRNSATGHVLELESDNIREFRSPDFLLLRAQLTISPAGVAIEPILPDAHSKAPPIQADEQGIYRFHVTVRGIDSDVRAFMTEARTRVKMGLISGVASNEWAQSSFSCESKRPPQMLELLATHHGVRIEVKRPERDAAYR